MRSSLLLCVLAACSGDGDGMDAPSDVQDPQTGDTGTAPPPPDTDGDGLSDPDELALGLDPESPDTDGDGYRDPDELTEGSDPLDPASLIYQGGWPYYADKDALEGGDLPGSQGPDVLVAAELGERFARLVLVDQFGDTVDLFDFYNADKPVVIDISAMWCLPCQELSTWLEGEDAPAMQALWPRGPEVVAEGSVYWITILGEDLDHLPAGPETAAQWHEVFPNPAIPVLADDGYVSADYALLRSWPTLVLLEPDLTVALLDPYDSIEVVLTELAARYPGEDR